MNPPDSTTHGPLLGIDYGEKRVGLAYADDVGIAVPLPAATQPTAAARLEHIARLARERRVTALIIGYPYNMDGTVGFKAREVDAFITKLSALIPLPIHRIDERLSSHQASADMENLHGGKNRKRQTIKARQTTRRSGELDSRAAALILRDYIETRRGPALLPDDPFDDDDIDHNYP